MAPPKMLSLQCTDRGVIGSTTSSPLTAWPSLAKPVVCLALPHAREASICQPRLKHY